MCYKTYLNKFKEVSFIKRVYDVIAIDEITNEYLKFKYLDTIVLYS